MNQNAHRVGRPRDPGKDHAVLVATRRLLVDVGYQQTTIAAIARRAEVSAPAIYRRWPTREALIEDAVHGPGAHALPEATGDLRADLETWVRAFLVRAASPAARAGVPGLLADTRADADRARLLALQDPVRVAFTSRLDRAASTGEIPGPVDATVLFDILTGTTSIRGLTQGDVDAASFVESLARALHVLACHGSAVVPEQKAGQS
ncbi:TetR/AcrR family transcriptional regulator [Rhodococcus sp. ABRD24]|uniref:TetR/AcrR family transcriptional regulator n=1 Tax=Rhodococcus sp. ABRD24 TaxID=2507582 RepID=UPI00103F3FCF|nr:TetR/AcrR family transcriptional regulator [Rhodococcus sp. ABRD24]QBJ97408.1 TetR/AcrR family transcriptional regulator [Rhodococcus sp. ABRD24]